MKPSLTLVAILVSLSIRLVAQADPQADAQTASQASSQADPQGAAPQGAAQGEGGAGNLSFALTGTVDPQVAYSFQNEDSAFAGLAPYTNASALGQIDGKLSFSREYTSLGLLDFTYDDAALLSPQDGSTIESQTFTVNELYSDLNFGDLLYLRLGKQRLSWGAGYVFNPSDPVNPPKDPTNQRAILEGVPALKAEIIAKPVSLMTFAVLYDDYTQAGYGAKLSTSAVKDSDLSLSGYWSPSQSWTGALNASTAPFYDLPGWDTVQLWFEGSAYGEARYEGYAPGGIPGAAETAVTQGTQYAALLGGSAQIPTLKTVALAEYYHLSEGLSADELAAVYKALRSANPQVKAASSGWYAELSRRPGREARDYLFASLTQATITDDGNPVFDKIALSATCLFNLEDGSWYAFGDLGLIFVKDTSVDLTASWAGGGADSEFGNSPTRLCLGLELKVFF